VSRSHKSRRVARCKEIGFKEVKLAPETLKIAVPPRLAGLRVAVKYIFELAHVCTAVCNKAYYGLYDPPACLMAGMESRNHGPPSTRLYVADRK
jgi:hypothetical protein